MAFVVTDACIKCKFTDCVEVCPVNCFKEGDLMLVIDPDVCIDCGICEPECPAKAIKPEGPEVIDWLERAREYSKKWPTITSSKNCLKDADKYLEENNKFEKYMKD